MNKDLINRIEYALQNIAMPEEIRILLTDLKEDVPRAKTAEQKLQIFVRWVDIIMLAADVVHEFSKYT